MSWPYRHLVAGSLAGISAARVLAAAAAGLLRVRRDLVALGGTGTRAGGNTIAVLSNSSGSGGGKSGGDGGWATVWIRMRPPPTRHATV
jgi:hypothetical protein